MNLNQDTTSLLTSRTKVGGGEVGQIFANVPTSQIGGGFSFTPGGVHINGDKVQSTGGFQFDLPMATVQAFQQRALDFSANNSGINRGFLGGVIQSGQQNVAASQQNVLSFGEKVMSSTENLTQQVLNTQFNIVKRQSRGCFITTAICEAQALPDNCAELMAFRKFRDEEMLDESGKAAVDLYYQIAPEIVARIKAREDGSEILATLRERFLMPAYHAILAREYDRARAIYYGMVIAARTMAEG